VHFLGEYEAFFVRALRFNAVGDNRIAMNIEIAVFDQIRIDRGIEPAVIDDVIHVAVNVVVHPAGVDDMEVGVVFAGDGHSFSSQIAGCVPPPSRGRLGGGWFSIQLQSTENHPHPNPPLEGEGARVRSP
jgi:hypothetical protein